MKGTGPCLGEHGQASSSNVFEKLHTIQRKSSLTPWTAFYRVWGSTTIRSFERCWMSAQHQNQTSLQNREMTWAVTGDVGERGPAINLNVFTWLQNIHTNRFFNTVNRTEPCLGEHNPAISSNVFKKLHFIQTKRFFNTAKCPGPCLGEHERPFIWTLLNVCITSKQNDFLTPQNELGRDKGCWGARPSHKLECV